MAKSITIFLVGSEKKSYRDNIYSKLVNRLPQLGLHDIDASNIATHQIDDYRLIIYDMPHSEKSGKDYGFLESLHIPVINKKIENGEKVIVIFFPHDQLFVNKCLNKMPKLKRKNYFILTGNNTQIDNLPCDDRSEFLEKIIRPFKDRDLYNNYISQLSAMMQGSLQEKSPLNQLPIDIRSHIYSFFMPPEKIDAHLSSINKVYQAKAHKEILEIQKKKNCVIS